MGYAIELQGKTFTPDGRADIDDIAAHNASIEAAELAHWATAPEHFACYVTEERYTLGTTEYIRYHARTWLGTELAANPQASVKYSEFRNRLTGTRMMSIRFKGTNGATYVGRFGSDWSQFCRLRKVK